MNRAEGRLSDDERHRLVEAIHATDTMLVLAVTGGGVAAVTDLLSVPGASRTVLEARVPYAAAALDELVGSALAGVGAAGAGAVSAATAEAMATACLSRANALQPGAVPLLGVACTAALTTDRTRRGANRAWIATATGAAAAPATTTLIELDESGRDRPAEDRLVADRLLLAIAQACGAAPGP